LVSCCHQLVHNKLFKNKMRTKVHLGISLGPSRNQLSGRASSWQKHHIPIVHWTQSAHSKHSKENRCFKLGIAIGG
jgi:hypothetical protein